jgi:flagellar motor switch protein FliG
LHPAQAEVIRRGLQDESARKLPQDQQNELLDNFERFFQFAIQNAPSGPQLFDPDTRSDQEKKEDEAKRRARMAGDPVAELEELSVYQIAGALETEQPRTVAILLSKFAPQLAAEVLALLLPDHRNNVVKEMARGMESPKLLVERIARATMQRGMTLPADPPDRRDRIDRLGELMREVPKAFRREMMAAIEEDDQELSQLITKKLYRFEDIVSLDGRLVQQILGEIDGTTLTTALFEVEPEILEAILGNLSRRARQTIEEELQFQTHVPASRVTAAREAVAEVIGKVDQQSE